MFFTSIFVLQTGLKQNHMSTLHTAYIALGSNQGERLEYLQKAIDLLYYQVGTIVQVSPVYQTPAWGFEGAAFLNLCLELKTRLPPSILLQKLLEIEKKLGRQRYQSGYQDRTIDLDILFYDDLVLTTSDLILPHPQIEHRRFVLQPLQAIAPDQIHPVLHQPISQLLQKTSDQSPISVYSSTVHKPILHINPALSYLVIEGNIGAGKSTLAKMIAEDYQAKLVMERFKDNPFLPKFYKNQKRYAFPLEMSFLADRYQQLVDDIQQYDLFNNFIVADYDIYKSIIFARITLEEEEFQLYKRLFSIMYKDIAKPNLYVYLYQNTARLLQNIKKRGRSYEQEIPTAYLEKINKGYLDFIKSQNYLKVKIIDISSMDFVENRMDYLKLLEEINRDIPN